MVGFLIQNTLMHLSIRNLKRRLKRNPKQEQYLKELLQKKLCSLGVDGEFLTLGQSFDGAVCLGSSGSGKSSSFSAQIMDGLLNDKDEGGIFLTVKSDESAHIIPRILKHNRGKDMVHFFDGSDLQFNFIEAARAQSGKLDVNLLSSTLLEAYRQMRNFKSLSGNTDSSDPFWDDMREILITTLITTLILAGEEISIRNINRLLSDSFSPEDVQLYHNLLKEMPNEKLPKKQKELVWQKFSDWLKQNYLLYCLELAKDKAESFDQEEKDALDETLQYWMRDWPDFAHETRSSIKGSMMALLKPFTTPGILKRHFSGGLSPELDFRKTYTEGKIIVFDFPSGSYDAQGAIATSILKYAFQQTIKRRKIVEEERPKPCFLFCDEIQAVLSPKADEQFQGIARSNMVTTVYISQSIHSIESAMGMNNALTRAKSLINNLGLKVFCANSDTTNSYASQLIGKSLQEVASTRMDGNKEVTHNYNQQLLPQVSEDHFTRLRTGGHENGYLVDCIIFKTGAQWKSGKNYLESTFKQSF